VDALRYTPEGRGFDSPIELLGFSFIDLILNPSWDRGGRCVGLIIISPSCDDCPEILGT
jgi:hypothetical protein